jgi:hypothetical protein
MKRRIKLSSVDREALTRALEIARAESPADREALDQLEKAEGWLVAAQQGVYDCQRSLTAPRLWQPLPMDINPAEVASIIARGPDNLGGEYAAARLLKKMLRAGLSRFEPEPLRRLAEIKRRAPEAATA